MLNCFKQQTFWTNSRFMSMKVMRQHIESNTQRKFVESGNFYLSSFPLFLQTSQQNRTISSNQEKIEPWKIQKLDIQTCNIVWGFPTLFKNTFESWNFEYFRKSCFSGLDFQRILCFARILEKIEEIMKGQNFQDLQSLLEIICALLFYTTNCEFM